MINMRRAVLVNLTRSFRHRNYRLWFAGQVISLFGTQMQASALGYYAYELTRSAAFLGLTAFCAGIPAWILMLFGGAIADRFSRRGLLVVTQTLFMVSAFVLAALVFTGSIRDWHLLALATFQGVLNAFDAPARQAFVGDLVSTDDIGNAVSLNSTMFNLSIVVGPSIGSALYALAGPGWCFFANGLSFIAVIAALRAMRMQPFSAGESRRGVLHDIAEGLRYILGHGAIRNLLVTVTAITMVGFAFVALFPAWSKEVLGGDVVTNGLLQAGRGLGALMAAIFIASRGRTVARSGLLVAGLFVVPLVLGAFAFATFVPLSVFLTVVLGSGFILVFNNANALIQTLAEERMRGRVMSVYALTFFGFQPLGALALGAIAHATGVFATAVGAATLLFLFAIAMVLARARAR